MDLHLKLWLLIATTAITVADVPFYVPQITQKALPGKLTSSTFALDQPQCIFNQYPTNDVWLVVALDSVVPGITDDMLATPVRYSLFNTTKYYHILRVRGADYPCSDTYGNTVAILLVGNELNCTEPTYCNGPLPVTGPYRVKFVVLNTTGLATASRWSEKFTLRTGKKPESIDTWPGRRSAGMIIIVTILSVLIAILLACLITALVIGWGGICWCRTIDNSDAVVQKKREPDVVYIMNYKTHHMRANDHENHYA
ncbi:uroplakin-3b-like [Discoglossus pictus]